MSTDNAGDGLREAVERLADEWECSDTGRLNSALHRAACFMCTRARDLRALLAEHPAAHPEPVPTPDSADDATVGERECSCGVDRDDLPAVLR